MAPAVARRSRSRRLLLLLLVAGLLAAIAAVAGALLLQGEGITPRALAPYVDKRTSNHNSTIVAAGKWSEAALLRLDRGTPGAGPAVFPGVGAQEEGLSGTVGSERRVVATSDEVRQAMAVAAPGDVITLLPGIYRFERANVNASRPGTAPANIVLRAERAGTVSIEMDVREGFTVSAPYWRFENLHIRGVCKIHSYCDHAFHVTGEASHFASVNNTIVDFNAHFKINGSSGSFPDHGRIEANTLRNDSVRDTANPVTPIDLVAASNWTIRRNLISDFVKGSGDRISYGAFAKGAGSGNVFEQNVVVCESRLQGAAGQRVGLSFGGGGTGQQYCRDRKCITEQEQGIMRANLVASCSDDGIYLNNAAASKVLHNTLADTGGLQVRFAASSADIEGNLVDGDIRSRNGGVIREQDNLSTPIALLYAGYHPQRSLFLNAGAFDFHWKQGVPRRQEAGALTPDLCGVTRPASPAYGAFEDIEACLKAP